MNLSPSAFAAYMSVHTPMPPSLYLPWKSITGADEPDPTSCIHCKTCDIKAPAQDINWQVRKALILLHPSHPATDKHPIRRNKQEEEN